MIHRTNVATGMAYLLFSGHIFMSVDNLHTVLESQKFDHGGPLRMVDP